MKYLKTTWIDRLVQRPRTYTETVNGDGTKTFTPSEGMVTAEGTTVNAARLNNIENGIEYNTNATNIFYSQNVGGTL
jgi:hypothetical protein